MYSHILTLINCQIRFKKNKKTGRSLFLQSRRISIILTTQDNLVKIFLGVLNKRIRETSKNKKKTIYIIFR